jgi:hypothetical protein
MASRWTRNLAGKSCIASYSVSLYDQPSKAKGTNLFLHCRLSDSAETPVPKKSGVSRNSCLLTIMFVLMVDRLEQEKWHRVFDQ